MQVFISVVRGLGVASYGSPVDNLAFAYTIAQVCSGSTAVPYLYAGLGVAGVELTRRRNAAIPEAKVTVSRHDRPQKSGSCPSLLFAPSVLRKRVVSDGRQFPPPAFHRNPVTATCSLLSLEAGNMCRMKAPDYICPLVALSSSIVSPIFATRVLYIHLAPGMELTPRSFLLFLRKLASFIHKKSIRGLWHIFALLRSRFSSRCPKERDENRRNFESRPAKPPTAVIYTSRLPQLTSIADDDAPAIVSPTPISIQIRQPTILNIEDTLYETHENHGTEQLGADDRFLGESRPVSRSPDSIGHHHEPHTSHTPGILSRPHSQHSHCPPSQYPIHRPSSQYSHRSASQYSYHSPPNPNGAQAAARGYLHAPPSTRPSSPALSIPPPSVAGSDTSHVYRDSRPTTRVRRSPPMRNTSQRRARSSTPASARRSVLRPMIGIDRYENHRAVTIEDSLRTHICSPVTTQFVP